MNSETYEQHTILGHEIRTTWCDEVGRQLRVHSWHFQARRSCLDPSEESTRSTPGCAAIRSQLRQRFRMLLMWHYHCPLRYPAPKEAALSHQEGHNGLCIAARTIRTGTPRYTRAPGLCALAPIWSYERSTLGLDIGSRTSLHCRPLICSIKWSTEIWLARLLVGSWS